MEIPFSRYEFDQLKKDLEDLKIRVLPLVLKLESEEAARNKIIISCAVKYVEANTDVVACGSVIRIHGKEPNIRIRAQKSNYSDEVLYDTIYDSLNTFITFYANIKYKDVLPPVEIHLESIDCVGDLINKNDTKNTKIKHIQDTILGLKALRNTDIAILWKGNRATWDLQLARGEI